MRLVPFVFAIFGFAIFAAPALADDPEDITAALARASSVAGGLTADQVVAATRATSPALAAHRADVAAATAALDQARDGYLPRLGVSARYLRLSSFTPPSLGDLVVAPNSPVGVIGNGATLVNTPLAFPVLVNATTVEAQLVVPISDDLLRVARVVAAARATADAAQYTERAARLDVAADARILYYAWARARLSAIVTADAVRQAALHLADVQQSAAAEHASRGDVMAVEAQLAAAHQLQVRADEDERVLATQLRIAMHGDAPAGALAIGEPLAEDLPLAEPGGDDALVADAIAHRLELRAAGADVSALAEQARAARAAALPRLDLLGEAMTADPNPRYIPPEDVFHTTWQVGVELTWAVTDVPAQLAQARALDRRADATAAQRAALIDALRAEVAQAVAAVRDAASAQRTTTSQLAAADEAYRVRRALFREGAATSTELSDAETARTRAQLDAIAAHIDARVAVVRLDHALGR